MRRLLPIVAVSLVGCAASTPPGPLPRGSGSLQAVAAQTLAAEADRPRQQLIKDELERTSERQLSFSAKPLDAAAQLLLQKLLEASRLVDEIRLLQGNRKALEYQAEVERSGTADDRRLFQRNDGPWCRHHDDVRCSTLRNQPQRPVGGGVWPEGLSLPEQRRLASRRELGDALAVVQRKGAGFEAVPLHRDPLLGPRVRELSQRLREAADLAGEPTLTAYLRGQAQVFVGERPEAQTGLDWIRARGRFEVLVGPYQPPVDSGPVKPLFGMLIGAADDAVLAWLRRFRLQLPMLEGRLARLLGGRLYKPRPAPAVSLQAVEVIRTAGSARLESGVIDALEQATTAHAAGQAGPEIKRVLLTNHLRVQGSQLATLARAVLTEGTLPQGEVPQVAAEQGALEEAVWRQTCRDLGPRPDHEIATRQGLTMLQKAMGELWPLAQQLQSELLSLWALEESRARLKLGEDGVCARRAMSLTRLVSLAQQEPEQLSAQTATVLLGWLLELKAVSFDEGSGRWSLEAGQLPRALRQLTRRFLSTLLSGDRAATARLLVPHLVRKGQSATFGDQMERLRLKARQAFANAGLKPVTLLHGVTDLRPPRSAPSTPSVDQGAKTTVTPGKTPANQ